jgi:hypothetical protein
MPICAASAGAASVSVASPCHSSARIDGAGRAALDDADANRALRGAGRAGAFADALAPTSGLAFVRDAGDAETVVGDTVGADTVDADAEAVGASLGFAVARVERAAALAVGTTTARVVFTTTATTAINARTPLASRRHEGAASAREGADDFSEGDIDGENQSHATGHSRIAVIGDWSCPLKTRIPRGTK